MTKPNSLSKLASAYDSGGLLGFRNRIINGAMMIDQRNAGASVNALVSTPTYTIDRWGVYSSGAGSTVQQVAGPNSTDKSLQVIPSVSNTYQIVYQRIESKNCIDLAGQTVTVSGRIYIDTATGVTCSVSITAATATDTNYATGQGSFAVTLTGGSYVSFIGQIALSSAAANGIELDIAFAGAAGKTIKITGVQLEKGSTATSFDYRPYGTELALCQRYYQAYPWIGLDGYTGSDGVLSTSVWLQQQMRSAPTISYGAYGHRSNTTETTPSTSTIAPTNSYILFQVTGTAGARVYLYNPVTLSAEL